jgi:conserved oligomeric Golgi complex subunit 1
VCAILLALHLLESRPFIEALNTFLAQRTKCLATALSRHKDHLPKGSSSDALLSPPAAQQKHSRTTELRSIRQRLKAVLEIVSRTLGSGRTTFLGEADKPALMQRVLAHIQATSPVLSKDLPLEVRLTSQTLLSSLPSSNHFLLLPANIKSYRPYADADSLASPKSERFASSLVDWFETAMQSIRSAMTSWFAELHTIRELWETRTWCRTWLWSVDGFSAGEKTSMNAFIDSVCRERAVEIWKSVLSSTDTAFRRHLESALTELSQSTDCLGTTQLH